MNTLMIEGGQTLHGKVTIRGAKNSVLKLMAASLLTPAAVTIENYPANMLDTEVHVDMLEALGKKCSKTNGSLAIEEPHPISSNLEWDARSIRNTLLILGALVGRTGSGRVPLPGGCKLGERKYDLHVMVLETLGARVTEEDDYLVAQAPDGLRGNDIYLPIRSTGATENAILCGTLAQGTTRVWNPHIRPEIMDLIDMLLDMGALIHVYGQERIEIEGRGALGGVRHHAIPDNMEAITWLIASVMTEGDIEIAGFPFEHLEVPLTFLRASGAQFFRSDDRIIVRGGRCYPVEISTGPYPGINSDMQPLFAALGACAYGESRIVDLRFAGRYDYAYEFNKMGIKTDIANGVLRVYGQGKNPLKGAEVRALDLRAGAALTLLGLAAQGVSVIRDAWQMERGYDSFFTKLRSLGARVDKEGLSD